PLTGLPNRAFLTDLLDRAYWRAQRHDDIGFAVLFLDLDRFKEVNDSLGHAAGDEMLREVSRRLIQSVRPGDVVSRFAGDEFCILLDDLDDPGDTTRVADRVQEALRDPIAIDGREVQTSVSIGIAVSAGGGPEPSVLLRNADNAMYRAKARGRDRYEVFDRKMHERVAELHSLEEDLKTGLEEGQFRVCYQPVVNLDTGTITALEALVRWHHPVRGSVPTGTFLSVAEDTGLIVPLGWWVLNEACRQMAAWAQRFPRYRDLPVGVNLSSKQLRQPDLVERIQQALDAADLPPRCLTLEVKEGDLMSDPEVHAPVIEKIRELGVDVEIDDFGTTSSFIQYLDQFQVSALKLDPSFVRLAEAGRDRDPVLQAIITLARSLGIRVVAEGVETSRQGDRLRDLRCEQGQGYLFARPLETQAVDQLLASRASGVAPN
ncbi:MAG TPA: EAL domain-containing protein, partial [Longimicrobiales bacterium]|nr:EAL domain-containing protein [Longimicrobiales bacterium]